MTGHYGDFPLMEADHLLCLIIHEVDDVSKWHAADIQISLRNLTRILNPLHLSVSQYSFSKKSTRSGQLAILILQQMHYLHRHTTAIHVLMSPFTFLWVISAHWSSYGPVNTGFCTQLYGPHCLISWWIITICFGIPAAHRNAQLLAHSKKKCGSVIIDRGQSHNFIGLKCVFSPKCKPNIDTCVR